jgi:predicted secreted Zn-dependent protease
MGERARLLSFALVIVLAAACGGQGEPSTAAPGQEQSPPASVSPSASTSPCAVAVTHLAAFTRRLADRLAALRPLVVATPFDSAQAAGEIRLVSGTLTDYFGLEGRLGACAATAGLGPRIRSLMDDAHAALQDALAAPNLDARVQRTAAVSVLGLLPEVLALSDAAKGIADGLGVQVAVATVPSGSDRPVGSLAPLATAVPKPTPRPTPKPTPKPPKAATISASFFGAGVKVTTYRVTGGTPSAISSSMTANGPYSSWAGGKALGQTKMTAAYRFVFSTDWSGACSILVEASPAIKLTYAIVLPRWSPPSGTSAATVHWWNDELHLIATHEKVHVSIYRAAAKRANSVLASSTCESATSSLESVWAEAKRDNCEFEMKEYGSALGLSLDSCLAR